MATDGLLETEEITAELQIMLFICVKTVKN